MSAIRIPVAAGSFYPRDAAQLAGLVDRLLDAAEAPAVEGEVRAIVVPHAGYEYSGAVAATAFALLRRSGRHRCALLGPSHFVPLRGVAVSDAEAWRTPLGDVPVDHELRRSAIEAGAVLDERPHRRDHALEVELPFLQRLLGHELHVLPVAVGGDGARVAAALAAHALVVVSSDLSHDRDDAAARRLDRETADAVVALDADAIGDLRACGADALRALLRATRDARWTCTLLDLRTSADATGDARRVVGYGAFAVTSRM